MDTNNDWNFANLWESCAAVHPDALAQTQGDIQQTWGEFNSRANGFANYLLAAGVERQDKVAQYMYNCPEYLESVFGCFKAALVPVNTNYRYTDAELTYLWDNSDAACVVFHGTFIETIERIRHLMEKVKVWMWVDDGSGECPDWAVDFEVAVSADQSQAMPSWGRTGQDQYFIYTGGTTGMPKGVQWEQDTLVKLLLNTAISTLPTDYDDHRERLKANGPGIGMLTMAPLMHGTGALVSFGQLSSCGRIDLLPSRSMNIPEMLNIVQTRKTNMIVIIGDVMAKPVLAELDANPGKYDMSSLFAMVSSGVMWSDTTKQGLLGHNANMMLIDALGSSEAVGMGQTIAAGGNAGKTAKFGVSGSTVVIAEDGTLVEPGDGRIGRLGVRGLTPVGYYKDPEKTAATFPVIDGVRYSLPGDFASIEADGTLVLLGRGSVCINSGGEKIFPEEVEEVLKTHPAIKDAVAVGLPDERWGETVNAVVEFKPGESASAEDVIAHVRGSLAAYKSPKQVFTIDTIGRGPNGKVDYKRMKAYAADKAGV
jgi:3-oxocholest-4-en-26-oate---CoA ligase